MGSKDMTSKSVDETAASPANPEPAAAVPAADKPKPARFDYAGANQAHVKSVSAMRGRNAGPVKKGPTRR